MIKINVITNNNDWFDYIKKPNSYLDKKIKKLNTKFKKFKKTNFFHCFSPEIKKSNILIRNLEKKIKQQMYFRSRFIKKDLEKKLKIKEDVYIGDIIINLNKIKNKNIKKSFRIEFDRLWIHGFVHLFGHDHKKIKISKECKILKKNISTQ